MLEKRVDNDGLFFTFRYSSKDGSNVYEGQWNDDKGGMHGYGRETFADGSAYVGLYKNGKKKGKGRLTFADGSYYEGDFEND